MSHLSHRIAFERRFQAPRPYYLRIEKQRGTAAVEFAVLAILFFTLVFGVMEIARLVYLFNTLQEVSRRAAVLAMNSPFDADSQEDIQQRALFRDRNGNLILGAPVTPAHLKIEYLSLSRDAAGGLTTPLVNPLPASPARNRLNCIADPYAANCIRFVRVRVCQPDGANACNPVPYVALLPLIKLPGLQVPRSETTVPAQTMGYTPGDLPGL